MNLLPSILWRSEARRVMPRSEPMHTRSASDLHNARSTVLNLFHNTKYKMISKIRPNKTSIEADIPCIITCGIKFLIHSQTSTAQPMRFGNRYINNFITHFTGNVYTDPAPEILRTFNVTALNCISVSDINVCNEFIRFVLLQEKHSEWKILLYENAF